MNYQSIKLDEYAARIDGKTVRVQVIEKSQRISTNHPKGRRIVTVRVRSAEGELGNPIELDADVALLDEWSSHEHLVAENARLKIEQAARDERNKARKLELAR